MTLSPGSINLFSRLFLTILGGETLLAWGLTLLPRLGSPGKTLSETLRKTPWLDGILSLLVWIPWVFGGAIAGWVGLAAAIAAQIVTLQTWIIIHEMLHRDAVKGPRIVRFLNQQIGWWRNHLALWTTILALPGFFIVRLTEIVCYPPLIWLLGFPKYDHSEWISISRFKFDGLVGHDLIWCLYCDWMTGVYSLGAEMLRNLESFWCPIRFYDGKKCENCQLDFPDIVTDWVAADGSMDDVETVLKRQYSGEHRSWYQHPERHETLSDS